MRRGWNQHDITTALADVLQISTDHAQASIFASSTRVRLQGHTIKASDDLQLLAQIVYQFAIASSLIGWYQRVNAHEAWQRERQHLRGRIHLHGARTQ